MRIFHIRPTRLVFIVPEPSMPLGVPCPLRLFLFLNRQPAACLSSCRTSSNPELDDPCTSSSKLLLSADSVPTNSFLVPSSSFLSPVATVLSGRVFGTCVKVSQCAVKALYAFAQQSRAGEWRQVLVRLRELRRPSPWGCNC